MTRIKICGLSREEDVDAANEILPDYIGFDFWPDSSHYITPERAVDLDEDLDEDITNVGVFADAPVRFVAALMNEDLIDIAQLQGSEDDAYIAALRLALRAPDEKAILKAFVISTAEDIKAAEATTAKAEERRNRLLRKRMTATRQKAFWIWPKTVSDS
jgi:phosphoribosylanthranilate isomerase